MRNGSRREIGRKKIMGFTVNEMKSILVREREVVKNMLDDMKKMRHAIRESRQLMKGLRSDVRREQQINRAIKADAREIHAVYRDAKRAERVAARIAKAEGRLEALKQREFARAQKGTKKSTKGVVWSAQQVAAMNVERGLV